MAISWRLRGRCWWECRSPAPPPWVGALLKHNVCSRVACGNRLQRPSPRLAWNHTHGCVKMTNYPGLSRVEGVLSIQNSQFKNKNKFQNKLGKLVSLGRSYPAVETGWLQSWELKATPKKKHSPNHHYPRPILYTQWGRDCDMRESGSWDPGVAWE